MAQYKVPQDVEADDKLLGPFSFRQFVYLMIAGGLIAAMVGLFQLFPALAIIPLPFALLFGALALPLRKDQPMETYLVALVSYYLKPKKQFWRAGQRESTIQITAPKIVEKERTRNLTGEEATHRLSFLADIVDTGGQAIKGSGFNNRANGALAQEAQDTQDIFEQINNNFDKLNSAIQQGENKQRNEIIEEMKQEIAKSEDMSNVPIQARPSSMGPGAAGMRAMGMASALGGPNFNSAVVVQPELPKVQDNAMGAVAQENVNPKVAREMEKRKRREARRKEERKKMEEARRKEEAEKAKTLAQNSSIIELANNPDYTIATIAKEANRIKEKMEEGEVFISLR